jgi:hypothetical protein
MTGDRGGLAASQQNMRMLGDQRPGKTKGFRLGDDLTQPFNEIIPVLIICEYSPRSIPRRII